MAREVHSAPSPLPIAILAVMGCIAVVGVVLLIELPHFRPFPAPPVPTQAAAAPTVASPSGDLDAFRARMPEVERGARACFIREMNGQASGERRVELTVTIAEDGTVSDTRVDGPMERSPAFEACVRGAVGALRFEHPSREPKTIQLPVALTPP